MISELINFKSKSNHKNEVDAAAHFCDNDSLLLYISWWKKYYFLYYDIDFIKFFLTREVKC